MQIFSITIGSTTSYQDKFSNMNIEFGYGAGVQCVNVPDKNLIGVLMSNPMEHERKGPDAVSYSLQNPIDSARLKELAKGKKNVVIVTSDISRPVPSYEILPLVLDELALAGVTNEQITIVLALGSHRNHSEDEKKKLVGEEVYNKIRCVDSDPTNCVHLGTSKRGTPVDIDKTVATADFRICLGNVEFHYFAGYSGGYKAIMPGCSTPSAIQVNHKMMIDENAFAGNIDTNPIRQDIEEAGKMCGVDFIVNVVLDEHKHVVYSAAGDPTAAHRDACKYLDKMYRKTIPARADIVIVSQGGAPKDANLYQTQKALDNAKHAVKKGGTIILIGACPEGLGSVKFEEWLVNAKSSHELISRVKEKFELGGHKAAAIAMVLENAEIDLVSEMEDEFVKSIFLVPKHSAEEAFKDAMKKYGDNATVIAMPFGGATLPLVNEV